MTDGLQARFDRFDRDASGFIDESEFALLVAELGASLTPEAILTAFAAIDINGDGQIDFREFRGWWSRQAGNR